jgi:hypothetical protein
LRIFSSGKQFSFDADNWHGTILPAKYEGHEW